MLKQLNPAGYSFFSAKGFIFCLGGGLIVAVPSFTDGIPSLGVR